jgi:hypothetical protein
MAVEMRLLKSIEGRPWKIEVEELWEDRDRWGGLVVR